MRLLYVIASVLLYVTAASAQTTIAFDLKKPGHVTLAVYNALGQKVAVLVSETQPAGRYEVTWDAGGLPSGLYFYQIRADHFHAVRKMVLIK